MKELSEYRYPGSRPFRDTSIDRILFRGREKETQILFHMILVEKLVILFAKSGIGKTSLLNAGVMKLLRDENYFPLRVTFTNPNVCPIKEIYASIDEAVDKSKIDFIAGEKNTLWQFFNTAEFWSSENVLMTPVLILDQFEELFTLHPEENRSEFIEQLADLVRGNVPQSVLDKLADNEQIPYSESSPCIKVIISLREDFLAELEEMSKKIPHILNNRLRLLELSRDQAKMAIEEPARVNSEEIKTISFVYNVDAINSMLDFLCRKNKPIEREFKVKNKLEISKLFWWKRISETVPTDEAEPFQLQLLCQHVETLVQKKYDNLPKSDTKGKSISVTKEDLGGELGMRRVLKDYYRKQIKKSTSFLRRKKAYKLFEKHLISKTDRRISLAEEYIIQKAKVKKKVLENLVSGRLIRVEPRVDSYYYELSHDALIVPIRKAQRERKYIKTIITALLILIYCIYSGYNYTEKTQKLNYYQKGDQELISGTPDKAIEYYEKAANYEGIDANLANQLGKAYEMKGEIDTAVKSYQLAVKLDNKYADAYFNLGEIYKNEKDYDRAIKQYRKATEANPEFKEAYECLGQIYFDIMNKYTDAYNIYKMLYKRYPEDNIVFENYVEANLATDRFSTAQDLSDKALRMQDILPETKLTMYFISIATCILQGKSNEAADRERKFIEYYRSITDEYVKVWSYNGTKNYIKNTDKLLNKDRDRAVLLYLIDILESPILTGNVKLNKFEHFIGAKKRLEPIKLFMIVLGNPDTRIQGIAAAEKFCKKVGEPFNALGKRAEEIGKALTGTEKVTDAEVKNFARELIDKINFQSSVGPGSEERRAEYEAELRSALRDQGI